MGTFHSPLSWRDCAGSCFLTSTSFSTTELCPLLQERGIRLGCWSLATRPYLSSRFRFSATITVYSRNLGNILLLRWPHLRHTRV